MQEKKQSKKNIKKYKVLVIDDEENSRNGLFKILQKEGYHRVAVADCGECGLKLCNEFKPNLIITDLRMPNIDGIEVLKGAKRQNPSTAVIVMTAYGEVNSYLTAMNLGAFEYLNKPVHLEELRRVITKSLTEVSCLPSERPDENDKKYQRLTISCKQNRLRYTNNKSKKKVGILNTIIKKFVNKIISNTYKCEKGEMATEEVDKYKAICGSIAHSLKSEFLIIGESIKELRFLASLLPDIQGECEIIERSVIYSQILLRRLLDYLNVGLPIKKKINVIELLRKAEILAAPRLPSDVRLKIRIDNTIKNQTIAANTDQLMGVLLELIDNASAGLHNTGGTIDIGIENKDNKLCISVADNGPGISKKLKRDLFKKQLTTKRGLGLGLFFCHKVVNTMGGELILQNSSKRGTTFIISLPSVDAD